METLGAIDLTVYGRLWTSLIAAGMLLLALASQLYAGENPNDQSDAEAVAFLTTNWWHVSSIGHSHGIVFNPDGTFLYVAINLDNTLSPRLGVPGVWQIKNGVLAITFTRMRTGSTVKLPLKTGEMHGVNNDGTPFSMTRDNHVPKIVEATSMGDSSKPANKRMPKVATAADETPAPAAALPVPAEVQQAGSAIIQSHHNGVVYAADSSGSAFVATIGTSSYLITNSHVAAGLHGAPFKSIDGTPLKGGAESSAVGEDLYCISLPAGGGPPFALAKDVDQEAAIGDAIVVAGKSVPPKAVRPRRAVRPSDPGSYFGTASGASAVTHPSDDSDTDVIVHTNIGHIVGIGPKRIEIDAPFTPADSGSPIVHIKSGKVIGVATYIPPAAQDSAAHYYGFRFDSVKLWQPISHAAFDAQASQIQRIQTLTADLNTLYQDLHDNDRKATPGRNTNPAFKNRLDQWADARAHSPSSADRGMADAAFASFLKNACQADITVAQRQITYDFFSRQLADEKAMRDQIATAFAALFQASQM